ncbi:DUF4230 domain-containing protein [Lewinella cohaerens]|uniref:DUF4230 domain-containing protein n=1 Tax=Lewinella cohaerens TaxID=70995 RepID=UPI00035FBBA5|nr:DUF4230 domain-containing protein [Lewinella cohaerens]
MAVNLNKANKIGRVLILICLIGIAVIVISRYYKSKPGSFLGAPKEYELNYMPSDYEMTIDPEDALAIANNPQRYRKEFNQMVYDINTSVLRHVSTRMGLSDSLQRAVLKEYEDNHHGYLEKLYYNDFVRLKDTTANIYETWYDNESGSATKVFEEITSKYTCYLINQILATVIPTDGGRIYAKGSGLETPCGIALTEALGPMIARMEERAAIDDFSKSRGLLQEKVETVIAELATMEVRDKKGINKQMQTKIWGVNVSSSDLEITAISILKVGFRLNDYFDIQLNPKANLVTVTLPEPVILSHEVYPKIEKLDIGWLREVETVNFNESFNALRKEFRREAVESNLTKRSEQQAVQLMNTMFGPLIKSMNNRYELKVEFRPVPNNTPEENLEDDGNSIRG